MDFLDGAVKFVSQQCSFMLNSIHLLNWRSHKDTLFEFSKGTNLIVGIMGSGKSSLLDAISFALFGTFPSLERRKLKLVDLPRLNEPQASVILEIFWEGHKIKVERSIKKSKKGASSDAKLFRDGKLIDSGTTAVTDYIERLLSIDYDLFTRAIYSEQNNIDYFLTLGPRERKQEIDVLLGLDKFETARINAVSVLNRFKSGKKMLEEKFSQERYNELLTKIQESKQKSEELKKQQSDSTQKLSDTTKSLEQSNNTLQSLIKKKQEYEQLSKDILRTQTTLKSLEKELEGKQIDKSSYESQKQKLSTYKQEYSKLSETVKQIENRISQLSRESGATDAKLSTIEKEEVKLNSDKAILFKLLQDKPLPTLEKSQEQSEETLIKLQSEKSAISKEKSEITETLGKLKPGMASCPLCNSSLDEQGMKHIEEEKTARIKQIDERTKEVLNSIKETQSFLQTLSTNIKKAKILSETISSKEKSFSEKSKLLERKTELYTSSKKLSEERSLLQKQLTELNTSINQLSVSLNNTERLLKMKKEYDILKQKLSTLESTFKTLSYNEKTYENARTNSEQIRLSYEKLKDSLKFLEKQIADINQINSLMEKEKSQLEKTKTEIEQNTKFEEELSIYKNALLETQTSLRQNLTDAINSAMNEIWSIFYPHRNYSQIRLQVTEKDYLFEVFDGSNWKYLETVASGGERACAALTLRVAMAMVLAPNLSWLILDEPTHNLDRDAVLLLSETLQLKVPEVIDQTVVITHEEALMGSDFAKSYKLTRDKEKNEPTKIEFL